EAIAVIRNARGVPVLAHPGVADLDALIPGLIETGLMGIEAWYNEHSARQTATYLEICRAHGLLATGGSDYHGSHTGRTNPPGTPAVPLRVADELRERAERLRGR
ncbi:MAG: PHP domain-containing protein, partial [Candidatus Rokuibacteriota bacterium]